MYEDIVQNPKRGFPKDKYFKSFDIGKSKIKLNPISSPDCSGNPFLVTELAEVTKKDCNEKQD